MVEIILSVVPSGLAFWLQLPGGTSLLGLAPLLAEYAAHRGRGERFSDYVIRARHVRATTAGNRFHADLAADVTA